MQALYESYPEEVEHGGRRYALDLDFRNVLRVFDLPGGGWTEREQTELGVKLLLRDPGECPEEFPEQAALLHAIFALFPESESDGEKAIDLKQDAGMIRSAFFRIGVDLTRDRLHFFRFMELLGDLPEDTALMRTVEIRKRPMPKPNKHNAEEIAALKRAKARVAIKMPEEEARRRFAASLKKSW